MTLLPPASNGRRAQSLLAKGHLEGFARLVGDFVNAIDPTQTLLEVVATTTVYPPQKKKRYSRCLSHSG
jgi:hypothetical protein